jgi:hypothetical protein
MAQETDKVDPEALPEESTTENLFPQEPDASTLIPESPDSTSEADTITDLEIPPYEEIPSYEEIPIPEERELVVPESKLKRALENKISLFELRLKASTDPQLQAEFRRAQQAGTYPERRQSMFNYYMGLYGKMLKMEPGLKDLILAEREVELRILKQTQIRPSTWPVPPPDFPVVPPSKEKAESSP